MDNNWHVKIGRTECFTCSATEIVCDNCKDGVADRVIQAARDWMHEWRGTGNVDNNCFAELGIAAECLLALDEYCKANDD